MLPQHDVVPFTTGDGFRGNLLHVRCSRPNTKGPVLLVHGAGVRANIFCPPVRPHLVDLLVERGYDVWLENWRASVGLGTDPPRWSLDQAALYDHPEAVKTVVRETGHDTIKAVIHCQGSTSFLMSAIAGLVPEVTTIISNAVSLHPLAPRKSYLKSKLALGVVRRQTDYLDAQWGSGPERPKGIARLILLLVQLFHHECLNLVCKMASFSYGFSLVHPVLWYHHNLTPETHEWIKGEFGKVSMRFFQQMERCFTKGHLVRFESAETFQALPDDYTDPAPRTKARIAFFAGERNSCFLKESQTRSFDYFNRIRRNYHSLYVLPGYGHLDVFIGKHAAQDVFPLMLAELEK